MHRFFLLACLQLAEAATIVRYEIKESHSVPQRWSRAGPAPRNHVMAMHIGLKQDRFPELEEQLLQISDPDHPSYGRFLSSEQVEKLVKPHPSALQSVLEWLEASGVSRETIQISNSGDLISLDLPVKHVEHLLDTTYHHYTHDEGDSLLRAPQWSLPHHLHGYIDTIQPTSSFLRSNSKAHAKSLKRTTNPIKRTTAPEKLYPSDAGYPDVSSACRNLSWTGIDCLSSLYGTHGYKIQAPHKNRIAVTNFDNQTQARSDLRHYLREYRPDAVPGADTFKNVLVAGGSPSLENFTAEQLNEGLGAEGNLDANLVIGLTYPTPFTTYSTGGEPPFLPDGFSNTNGNEPFLAWLKYILNHTDAELPYVVSISYGDDEQSVPHSYATSVCNLFAQLGARGVSVLVSSGDSGVGPSGACLSNDGKKSHMFVPAFPASCPYVTTVGGTQYAAYGSPPDYNYTRGSLPEVVWDNPYEGVQSSGGGFSNYFKRPSYQDVAVQRYHTSLGGQWSRYYNRTGRAYPDIAALADNIVSSYDGYIYQTGGTSAATPIAASVFALLNDARLASGQAQFGFLNPLLYKLDGHGFHDITKGNNTGCTELTKFGGFPAREGWDAATGFGTPNFQVLRESLVNPSSYMH